MRTEPSLHLPISWTPLLRLTHERGRPHHDVITIAHTGEGVSRALMAPGQALELQERRSAERCRIEPTADAASGWQLVNDSPDLVCALNGQRMPRGHAAAIKPGDKLELGLLRFVIESASATRPPTTAHLGPEPAAVAQQRDASNESSDFDLRDLARPTRPAPSAPQPRADALGMPGFIAEADAPAPGLIDDLEPALPGERLLADVGQPAPPSTPEDSVMHKLHQEFERAVRAPGELQTRLDWGTAPTTSGEAAPSLDDLRQASDKFHLLIDVLGPRPTIDALIASVHTLGDGLQLDLLDQEVLSLFAPELAAQSRARMPEITLREHHALSPDSPIRIGHPDQDESPP